MTPTEFNSAWIIENLPDSSAMRRKVLQNILSGIDNHKSDVWLKARQLLASMDVFDAEQRNLPFTTQPNRRDGNGNSEGGGK